MAALLEPTSADPSELRGGTTAESAAKTCRRAYSRVPALGSLDHFLTTKNAGRAIDLIETGIEVSLIAHLVHLNG